MVNGKGIVLASFALSLGVLTQPALADVNQTGVASYYWQGQGTASGERFNANALTAAHRSLPFNTKVKVTNLRNGRSVIVRINDRGPFIRGRIIDVSRAAATQLGFTGHGVTRVSLSVVGRDTVVASADEASSEDQAAKSKARTKEKTAAASTPQPSPKVRIAAAENADSSGDGETPSKALENGGWTLVPSPATQVAQASSDAETSQPAQ